MTNIKQFLPIQNMAITYLTHKAVLAWEIDFTRYLADTKRRYETGSARDTS